MYTSTFYERLKTVLDADSVFVVQTTSPLVARKSYWCIENTIRQSGFSTLPYHTYVPSFGEWGFVMGGLAQPLPRFRDLPERLRFLSAATFQQLTHFSDDMSQIETEVNKLNNQILVHYYEEEWGPYEQFS